MDGSNGRDALTADRRFWSTVAALALAFVLMRLPHLGHLLSFDEAWNALAIRSLATGTEGPFRFNFLRHPPLYMLAGQLVAGTAAASAVRLELLTLAINAAALVVLLLLSRRAWGDRAVLWVGLAAATLPAGILYDTWIKRDCVVTLFGLLAILQWKREKDFLTGICLGLAFLGKETALFYAGAIFCLAVFPPLSRARLYRLLRVAGITALVSGWWYVMLWHGASNVSFFRGGNAQSSSFAQPFGYYLLSMPRFIGWAGVGLGAVGAFCIATDIARGSGRRRLDGWPLMVLVPALGLLSLSAGKPSWMVMPLVPALAALVGCGAAVCLAGWGRLLRTLRQRGWVRGEAHLRWLGAAVVVCLLLPRPMPYQVRLARESAAVESLSRMSHEAAMAVNRFTRPGDRLLMAPFTYERQDHCPVFNYYVEPRDVLFVERSTPFDEMTRMIREYRLDWALVSPGPDPGRRPLTQRFAAAVSRRPIILEGAVLVPVRDLH